MELIFDYMENDMLRHKLNVLTQKIYGFDFEDWMARVYLFSNLDALMTPHTIL